MSSEYSCPSCGSPLVPREGRRGTFLACSAYPKCRTALNMDAEGRPVQPPDIRCERCDVPTVIKRGPRGLFLGCSTYPRCRGTKPMDVE
jgi:DNA topoisomerase-1